MKKILLALTVAASTFNIAQADVTALDVIYGTDDRYDVSDYPDSVFREKAKSVAGMVARNSLQIQQTTSSIDYLFDTTRTLQQSMMVCDSERFAQQSTLPSCTGFLVGKDTLVTAGHCVTSQASCNDNVWVFDFTDDKTQIAAKDVYRCKEIVGQRLTMGIFSTKDYAVIKLDRVVQDRKPLQFRTKGSIDKGDNVLVIGHPSGLPLKIADNASVKDTTLNTFRANLDTYGGNSGSPVFNERTGLVEGILIQGAQDYEINYNERCYQSARRAGIDKKDSKERVFKITKVKEIQ